MLTRTDPTIKSYLQDYMKDPECILNSKLDTRLLQATGTTDTIKVFNIPLERSDPSQRLFSDAVMNSFAKVTYSGNVEGPASAGDEPNGGYAAGEDASDIWGSILAETFAGLLYCKLPDIIPVMKLRSCGATCSVSC